MIIKVHTLSFGMYRDINQVITFHRDNGEDARHALSNVGDMYKTFCGIKFNDIPKSNFKPNSWVAPIYFDDGEWEMINGIVDTVKWSVCHECYEKLKLDTSSKTANKYYDDSAFNFNTTTTTPSDFMTILNRDEVELTVSVAREDDNT